MTRQEQIQEIKDELAWHPDPDWCDELEDLLDELEPPEEWPEERIHALVARYEETDQLALQESLNQKEEWDATANHYMTKSQYIAKLVA